MKLSSVITLDCAVRNRGRTYDEAVDRVPKVLYTKAPTMHLQLGCLQPSSSAASVRPQPLVPVWQEQAEDRFRPGTRTIAAIRNATTVKRCGSYLPSQSWYRMTLVEPMHLTWSSRCLRLHQTFHIWNLVGPHGVTVLTIPSTRSNKVQSVSVTTDDHSNITQ